MKRREFSALLGAAVAFPRIAFAQQTAKLPRVAFLWQTDTLPEYIEAYKQGMADFGYVDGKTVVTETFGAVAYDVDSAAVKVVATKPDLIVTDGTGATMAAMAATKTMPIVSSSPDPVGQGFAASFAHPGANVTGTTNVSADLVGRQVSILKEVLPSMKRLAGLNVPGFATIQNAMREMQAAATSFGVESVVVDFKNTADLIPQFDRVVSARADAAFIPAANYFQANRETLFDLQIKYWLPMIWPAPLTPSRALVGYGANRVVEIRKTGAYVDAILKGAKAADLPIQQPTKFDLAINLATAKAIGITVPPSILAQATTVIE